MEAEKIICIGILDKEHNGYIQYFIDKFLIKYGYRAYYRNKKGNINCFCNYLNRLIIINMNKRDLRSFFDLGIEPDIILIDELEGHGYNSGLLVKEFFNCRYYIINSDIEDWSALGLRDKEGIVLTYGFNPKSTITISSYNPDSNVKANICLQRELITIDEKKIEPFEFTVEIEAKLKDNIYSLIGATALLLILGHKDDNIQIIDNKT